MGVLVPAFNYLVFGSIGKCTRDFTVVTGSIARKGETFLR